MHATALCPALLAAARPSLVIRWSPLCPGLLGDWQVTSQWPITKNLLLYSHPVGDPTAVQNLVQIRPRGLLANGWNITKNLVIYLYIFFGNSPTGQTRRRIFTLDGSNDADSRKDVPFGGFADIAFHFGVKYPQNPNFWGVNRRFQAKRAKYWKFHIIETTVSISTTFCTTIETTKWSSCVAPIAPNKSKMANGRHFEKLLNR